jgi:mono/diheme cytochrome c family protein
MRLPAGLLALLLLAWPLAAAEAQTPAPAPSATLTLAGRDSSARLTQSELIEHGQLRTIAVPNDPVFKRGMTYRAVSAADLLKGAGIGPDDYVQARAIDNFSVAIPAGLLLDGEAFVAVEDPARPWPLLRKGTETYSAGPFYLVWTGRRAGAVSSEFWVYRLAALSRADSPAKRWPQLAVAPEVPADDPVREGLDRFVAVCLACHRFRGAGEGAQGPDLGQPMNPVDYFRPGALRRLLRDPDSVRSWPDRKMPAFTPEMLSDADLDAILAWLAYKARATR